MKVLHINWSDIAGGAAIAASRHNQAMRQAGIDSKMLVLSKRSNDPYVIEHKTSNFSKFLIKVFEKLFIMRYHYFASWSLSLFGFNLVDEPVVKDADVVIMHWINNFTMSISTIEKLLKLNKPVYWFMHDMWPLTGGCHYSLECEKYQSHCGKCPMNHQKKGSRLTHDLSYIQFEQKNKSLSRYENLYFITPSQWLADKVKNSALFGNHKIFVCHNVLDLDVFTSQDKLYARERLGLPQNKKLILFGADNLSNPYKGWPYLQEALSHPIIDTECVLYGACNIDLQKQIPMKVHTLGKISDLKKLVDLYSACDVFVTPSLADNYPNVIIEAMACGLPVVGFASGGIPEMIDDNKDGILVREYSSSELHKAIVKVLQLNQSNVMSEYAREKVLKNNAFREVYKKYNSILKLY